MDGSARTALAAECAIFCRYLLGTEPAPAVRLAYERAHDVGSVDSGGEATAFDRVLLAIAGSGPAMAQIADAYSSLFARASLLRRKLVLLVAILESLGSTAAALDTASPGSRGSWAVEVALRLGAWGLRAIAGVILIGPVHLWCTVAARPRDSR